MNKEINSETFLNISSEKFEIYSFDVNSFKNLYINELVIENNIKSIDFDLLKKFLDNNIYKIEKQMGKFVQNIFIIINNKKILSLELGIKKKNYNNFMNIKYLKNYITEAKDLFKENYETHRIMHIILNKYLIDDKISFLNEDNLKCDQISLEIQFISLPNNIAESFDKLLGNYQIKIKKFIDGNYLKNFLNSDSELSEVAHKLLNGYNQKEVMIVPKNQKKMGFFEKFFQLFS
tara:strand:- start:446 stop:1147 length:702 start_codon:yes stop_codon:yes gene_type:complete